MTDIDLKCEEAMHQGLPNNCINGAPDIQIKEEEDDQAVLVSQKFYLCYLHINESYVTLLFHGILQ